MSHRRSQAEQQPRRLRRSSLLERVRRPSRATRRGPPQRETLTFLTCGGGPRLRCASPTSAGASGSSFLTHPPSPPAGLVRHDGLGSPPARTRLRLRAVPPCVSRRGFHSGSLPDTAPLRDMTFRQFRQSVDETGVELATEIPAAHSQHPFSLREEAPLAPGGVWWK